MGLEARGHITQTVKVYAVIGKIKESKCSRSSLAIWSMSMSELPFGIKLRHLGWGRSMVGGGRSKQQTDN